MKFQSHIALLGAVALTGAAAVAQFGQPGGAQPGQPGAGGPGGMMPADFRRLSQEQRQKLSDEMRAFMTERTLRAQLENAGVTDKKAQDAIIEFSGKQEKMLEGVRTAQRKLNDVLGDKASAAAAVSAAFNDFKARNEDFVEQRKLDIDALDVAIGFRKQPRLNAVLTALGLATDEMAVAEGGGRGAGGFGGGGMAFGGGFTGGFGGNFGGGGGFGGFGGRGFDGGGGGGFDFGGRGGRDGGPGGDRGGRDGGGDRGGRDGGPGGGDRGGRGGEGGGKDKPAGAR